MRFRRISKYLSSSQRLGVIGDTVIRDSGPRYKTASELQSSAAWFHQQPRHSGMATNENLLARQPFERRALRMRTRGTLRALSPVESEGQLPTHESDRSLRESVISVASKARAFGARKRLQPVKASLPPRSPETKIFAQQDGGTALAKGAWLVWWPKGKSGRDEPPTEEEQS
jgi:hypothetical protein